MPDELSKDDCEYILECLEYTKRAYNSTTYPTHELRKAQFDRLSAVQEKLRRIRDRHVGGVSPP